MNDKIEEILAEPLAQKVLFFNEMLTPDIIRIAYWLCLIAVVWSGLGHMFSGGFFHFLEGIAFIATGAILARVGAEIIIVLFNLNESMERVATNTVPQPAPQRVTKTTRKVSKKASKKA